MSARFSNDESFSPDSSGLAIFFRHSVIADVGARHCDDLSFIRRIRQNFLVARHGGMEDDLPHGLTLETERATFKDCPVCQCENSCFQDTTFLGVNQCFSLMGINAMASPKFTT